MLTNSDLKYLEEAIETAEKNISTGGGPFGALVVRDGVIIAKAANRVVALSDPTAHAEIIAIREASAALATHILDDCTLYASCEPCPMCLGAIYWAGIRRVVYAATRSDAAAAGFNDEKIYEEIALPPGHRSVVFENACREPGIRAFAVWEQYPGKVPY